MSVRVIPTAYNKFISIELKRIRFKYPGKQNKEYMEMANNKWKKFKSQDDNLKCDKCDIIIGKVYRLDGDNGCVPMEREILCFSCAEKYKSEYKNRY